MTIEDLKKAIGDDIYLRLNEEAEKEVVLSLNMELVDKWRQEKYYHQRFLLNELSDIFYLFENLKLKVLPVEIVSALFRCKMVFAVNNEKEYMQRAGGSCYGFWQYKKLGIDGLIDIKIREIFNINEKKLLSPIKFFRGNNDEIQAFFDKLFAELDLPFSAYIKDENIIDKHKEIEPGYKSYDLKSSRTFFQMPSIAYSVLGSDMYITFYAMAHLRAFFNILRIASFIRPPQIDFDENKISIMAPESPTILGSHCLGCYCWDEYKKRPWEKIPDGSVFLSFGYRGLSEMWLDTRTHEHLNEFISGNKIVFEYLSNPWSEKSMKDIEPTLDILSSVTQMQDLGAKILLIYCALEHLFVPGEGKTENKTFIIGGINALKSDLLPWFDELYKLRCSYAHKGYITYDEKLLGFIFTSVNNVFSLLVLKLGVK